jgi:gluconate 2-dehydrogenase gamma chain
MPKWNGFGRRKFLGMGLAASGAATLVSCGRVKGPSWRFFTDDQSLTIQAICEQLIPPGRGPGAAEAGVPNYIDRQLTLHLKRHQQAYRQGLATVDNLSRQRFGGRFVQLSWVQQTQVLMDLEKRATPFFNLIVAHTMQGFYGDPRHGGNRDGASWKMLGLPFPPVRGRIKYESKAS